MPAIDDLLRRQDCSKNALTALFVCTGPGSYAGVRAGMSVAKGLSFALGLPLVGIGRLEIQSYAFAATRVPLVAVHRAGRSDLAWAAYISEPDWRELVAPRLTSRERLPLELPPGSLVTGDVDSLLADELSGLGHRVASGAAAVRHAALLAELGWRRLSNAGPDDPSSLEPIYLREPAIGPQS
jgi:tRNA threonylcarbamoyladenosine biosynthesis protein TsaB